MASTIKSDNGVSSGVTGIVQTADSTGQLALQTTTSGGVATTAVTIDNSQNVGVGVTPSAWGTSNSIKALQLTSGSVWSFSTTSLNLYQNAYFNGTNPIYINNAGASAYALDQGSHKWYTAGAGTGTVAFTQAMTLDNSGRLQLGTTSVISSGLLSIAPTSSQSGYTVQAGANGNSVFTGLNTSASATFYVLGSGQIYSTSTSITAISDQTLKTNIKPLETGLSEINKLQPRRFDWKDGSATNVAGFISQEVETVLSDLVGPYKQSDELTVLGLRMGDMIPTMVKAIQELSAEVTALKAKLGV